MGLAGRVVLVTGASSGVGLATSRTLLEEGAAVVVCARNMERLEAATSSLQERFAEHLLRVRADVTVPDDVEGMIEAAVERFGGVDGLVNNAGQGRMSTFSATDDDTWEAELRLKFASIVLPVRTARPHLAASPTGAIVNVNAVLARQPEPRLVATSAARSGALNLSRSLATELAPDGIRVNTVLLGLIDTGQWRRRFDQAQTDLTYEAWSNGVAVDRGVDLGRFGRADEVAAVVVFLLSACASYITGTAVEVDGGVHRYA